MQKNYTIKDIAELAGVSKGTVDRVLHKRGKVSELAMEKVNAVLNQIDYKPNLLAKNLKNNKRYRVSILLPDPKHDPYWTPCVTAVNTITEEFNAFSITFETYFFNPKNTASFLDANAKIMATLPDAVLMVPLFLKESATVLQQYETLNIIVSTINNNVDSNSVKSFIGQDLHTSGRVAAKLMHSLIREGNIAIIHIDEKYKNAIFMQQKEKGFKRYFNELNAFNGNITPVKLKHPDFEDTLTRFINQDPFLKGIFVTTSKAYQVADVLNHINRNDIALIGYDLLNENVAHLKQGGIDFLIHQNPKQQTYLGLKNMVEFLLFDKPIPEQIHLPIDIINSENVTPFMRD
ncbi:MAG: substrate-binding domain-containing protein [Flavobacteriaceae bacterium]